MTPAEPDEWLAVREACASAGLDPGGARLIHRYSNAIYLLPVHNAVARVTLGADAAGQISRSQEVTRWLASAGQFPATRPLDDTTAVVAAGTVVSFWEYYPQPSDGPPPTSAHLALILRLLHRMDDPPVTLPAWIPLQSLQATIAATEPFTTLTDDERDWIRDRIGQVRDAIDGLDWPLGYGLIHGDAWAGNLLSCPGRAPAGMMLGDWDWVSFGPREVDLIPTWHAATRYGKGAAWADDFAGRYGYDLAKWDGCPVLMAMRDLVQLTGPIRRAQRGERYRQALRQRLDGLRANDTLTTWTPL